MFFPYGEEEIQYLKKKDKRLGGVIDAIGRIDRAIEPDLFKSVVYQIVGQQISVAAHQTIWRRMCDCLGDVTPQSVDALTEEALQGNGISLRKAGYIKDFARQVHQGQLDLDALHAMDDGQVIGRLSSLRGIGVWTAEMLLIFSMKRPDVLSFGDLGIQRGLRMLYRHRRIDRALFDRYKRRYSPYGSTAAIYLWAISSGALPGLTDPAPKG